jgi:flavin reductase ActVB
MTHTVFELDGSVHTVAGHVELDDTFVAAQQQPRRPDDEAFRAAMRVLAAGVVMVTTRHEGRPWGLTISACCSLTLEPPQILISLRSTAVSCQEILEQRCFGVSILAARQKNLAELGAAVGVVKFVDDYCEGDDQLESPMISGALYHLDCVIGDVYEVGDHTLIIGRVQQAVYKSFGEGEAEPLVYFDRAFWKLGQML